MRIIDHISIEIYNELLVEYEKNIKQNGHYLNVFGIFMHEIMIYLSNFVQIKNSKSQYDYEIEFPFLNSNYIEYPFEVNNSNLNKLRPQSFKRLLVKALFFFFRFGKKCSYSNDISGEVLKFSTSHLFKIQMEYINDVKCFLPNKDDQFSKLNKFLYRFCEKNEVKNSEIFCNNFISYIDQFIQDKPPVINSALFLSSSNLILNNRIIASHFLENNKSVIAFAHGEHDMLALDDPASGYGEMSYCTYFVSYGSNNLVYEKYNKPLKGHSPIIKRRDSAIVRSFYKSSKINTQKDSDNGLYIANGFNANYKWGPFQHHDDEFYMEWQNILYSINNNLAYKSHPSSRSNEIPLKASTILDGNLNKINLQKYGYIVIDFFSTAMAVSSASNLPIIYFNLGLMNLNDKAKSDLKKRVYWVDINLKGDIKEQVTSGFKGFFSSTRKFNKQYSVNYSLSNSKLKNILNSIIFKSE
tara:strand:- start:757 stop:2163 length:1407 start_codon:yes stop_codon:yes gene_type:complete